MKVSPILFSAPMILALLENRKTQTRRLNSQPRQAGDVLYVRENFRLDARCDRMRPVACADAAIFYEADQETTPIAGRLRPAIHLPRNRSRLTLPVQDFRIEPLLDISEEDAIAEGVVPAATYGGKVETWLPTADDRSRFYPTARDAYFALWDRINGAGSAIRDPVVFATTFVPLKVNVDTWLETATADAPQGRQG